MAFCLWLYPYSCLHGLLHVTSPVFLSTCLLLHVTSPVFLSTWPCACNFTVFLSTWHFCLPVFLVVTSPVFLSICPSACIFTPYSCLPDFLHVTSPVFPSTCHTAFTFMGILVYLSCSVLFLLSQHCAEFLVFSWCITVIFHIYSS